MAVELVCPHCGGIDIWFTIDETDPDHPATYYTCEECEAKIAQGAIGQEEVIDFQLDDTFDLTPAGYEALGTFDDVFDLTDLGRAELGETYQ